MPDLIAIVGRPNVGKSALFNRIVGQRIAIVHDQPGVTRDRVSAEAEWHGRPFTLVDTGGIGLLRREKSDDVIIKAALEQVEMAIEAANAIILVVNVQEGIVPLDREVAEKLRRSGKPVLVAVNKVDTQPRGKGAGRIFPARLRENFPRQRDSRRRHSKSDGCGGGGVAAAEVPSVQSTVDSEEPSWRQSLKLTTRHSKHGP